MLLIYRTLKQDTTKHTPFDLTYGRTAILPINFTVETYLVQPINKKNLQETLQRRAYTFLSTLEGKRKIAATHIEHFQAQQKEKHDNKLPPITNKFKIRNKVVLHRTKTEKQWNGKFENKWNGPFYIHEILGNGLYKLRLDDKVLAKVAHGDRLKHYYSRNNLEPLIPQISTHSSLINLEDIPRNLEPIIIIEQQPNLNT
ncbi:hypothetical protein G9A89_004236 [Geosiphon pyriformis]|nr:hypothetical protein G9A89_004236 [Geosiphon pyriformis]